MALRAPGAARHRRRPTSPRRSSSAYISPVLTAHPTEVQRKSILDAERAIAELLAARDAGATERELADNEALMRARVTQLWQTRMLRTAKLTRRRRDRERAQLLPRDLPAPDPELYREIEEALPGPRDRAVLPHGQLDRRRPRRQPQRQRRARCASRSRARARRRCAST